MNAFDKQEFIDSLKNGDEKSFTALYDAYGQKIYILAIRLVGNAEEAKDLVQETFLQAHRYIADFKGECHIYTWLYRIAKNLCYRAIRRQRKSSFIIVESLINSAQADDVPSDISRLERLYLIEQVKEGCLTGLIRCLSFHQRLAFVLHVLLRLPVKDVADVLEKTEGATKVLIHRARKNLKEFLCKNCSLFDSTNSCRCEGLIDFSLKQGWIEKPVKGELHESTPLNAVRVEEEIEDLRKITELYTNLPNQHLPTKLGQRIRQEIAQQGWSIFSTKKV